MIKIVKGNDDPELQYLNADMFWRLYEQVGYDGANLVALATTFDELVDVENILKDLTNKEYSAAPPKSQSN